MTISTKVVVWVGGTFGAVGAATVALIIGMMIYTGYRNAEQQRQAQEAWKHGLAKDLNKLQEASKDYMKPVDLNRVFVSPSPGK